jgi:hypothetical protein
VKTFRLADYAADGALQDLDDARFFARKLGPEDRLDFEGVSAVSSDFLDVLLAGQKPDSLVSDYRLVPGRRLHSVGIDFARKVFPGRTAFSAIPKGKELCPQRTSEPSRRSMP